MQTLGSTTIAGERDILLGRGKPIQNRPANRWFQSIIAKYKPDYDRAQKSEKASFKTQVKSEVQQEGCRFLKRLDHSARYRENRTTLWREASSEEALEKISQAFRRPSRLRKSGISVVAEPPPWRTTVATVEGNDVLSSLARQSFPNGSAATADVSSQRVFPLLNPANRDPVPNLSSGRLSPSSSVAVGGNRQVRQDRTGGVHQGLPADSRNSIEEASLPYLWQLANPRPAYSQSAMLLSLLLHGSLPSTNLAAYTPMQSHDYAIWLLLQSSETQEALAREGAL